MANIKKAGNAAKLTTVATPTSTNVYGVAITADTTGVTVYEDAIAPEITLLTGSAADIALDSSLSEIVITFSEDIDDTIEGLYTNDFTVTAGGTTTKISSATVANNKVTLNLEKALTASPVTVKAVSANISIRDLKDTAETQTLYVPTTTNINGTTVTIVQEAATTGVTLDVATGLTANGTTTGHEYSVDGGTTWVDVPVNLTVLPADLAKLTVANGFKVRVKATTATRLPGAVQTIAITKAATPTTAALAKATNTGTKLTSVAATMEYRVESSTGTQKLDWTDIAGTTVDDIDAVATDVVKVRVKATTLLPASAEQSITVQISDVK